MSLTMLDKPLVPDLFKDIIPVHSMSQFGLRITFPWLCCASANAALLYDEAASGDLLDDDSAPTLLEFIEGANVVRGSTTSHRTVVAASLAVGSGRSKAYTEPLF